MKFPDFSGSVGFFAREGSRSGFCANMKTEDRRAVCGLTDLGRPMMLGRLPDERSRQEPGDGW